MSRGTTMLGSEYNWLISLTRPVHGSPRVRLANNGMLTLLAAAFFLICLALLSQSTAPAEGLSLGTVTAAAGSPPASP